VEYRFSKTFLCTSSVFACLLLGASAQAAPKDAEAAKIARTAIYEDYLATNFTEAAKKLNGAIDMCKGTACSPKMRAQLQRDLGIVCIVGLKKTDEGKAHFVQALKADPFTDVPKELSTPETQAAMAAAKKSAAGAEAEAPTPKPAAAAAGDIVHAAPTEQAVSTPIPVYAELPDATGVTKMQLRYKASGAANWKTAEMKKYKTGFAGEIPCADVGSERGEMKYFLQAVDANGDIVATSGTRNSPHSVPIVAEVTGDAPHLPGKSAPMQCASAEGKKRKGGTKGYGAACDNSNECQEGLVCKGDSGLCEKGPTGEGGDLPGQPGAYKKNWLSLAVQSDWLMYPSRADACSGGNDITCYWSDNSFYTDTPSNVAGNQIKSGVVRATFRFLVGYDRLITNNIAVGMRFGLAVAGSPATATGKTFQSLHAEGRVAYWFGSSPFARNGLRFYAAVSGGLAEVDAKVVVPTYPASKDSATSPSGNTRYDANDPDNLLAWKRTGQTFLAIGPGLMYAFTKNTGAFFEPKLMQMFGSAGTVFAFQLGVAQGF
jgi:hypothetical protein